MATKTMAILSHGESLTQQLLWVLGCSNYRLLFVVENDEKLKNLQESLNSLKLKAEIEFISCEKEGCWEADKILVSMPGDPPAEMIEKIKDVAIQKPVWVISEKESHDKELNLQKLLPNSRVVEIGLKENLKEISLCSKDDSAKEEIRKLFQASGYTIK